MSGRRNHHDAYTILPASAPNWARRCIGRPSAGRRVAVRYLPVCDNSLQVGRR